MASRVILPPSSGAAGAAGPPGIPGQDAELEDAPVIPGPKGDAGAAGAAGAAGPPGIPGQDAELEDAPVRPPDLPPSPVLAYTPALTASTTNPTLGGGAVEGHYVQIGKLVIFWGSVSFGATMTPGSGEYHISVPIAADATAPRVFGTAVLYDDSAGLFRIAGLYSSSGASFRFATGVAAGSLTASDTNPWVWANKDALVFQGSYIAA